MCKADTATGVPWGGWNCSADNVQLARRYAERRFTEKVWDRHYRWGGKNLSRVTTPAEARHALPWSPKDQGGSRSGEGSFPAATFGIRHSLPWLIRSTPAPPAPHPLYPPLTSLTPPSPSISTPTTPSSAAPHAPRHPTPLTPGGTARAAVRGPSCALVASLCLA